MRYAIRLLLILLLFGSTGWFGYASYRDYSMLMMDAVSGEEAESRQRAEIETRAQKAVSSKTDSSDDTIAIPGMLSEEEELLRGVRANKKVNRHYIRLIGNGIAFALLFVITDYYTSTRFRPVRKTAEASQTGHATNIISGLAQGLQATALPALVLVLGVLCSWKLAGGGVQGIYGIGVAVMGQLSLTGLIVALDAFGPITDNAGGIAPFSRAEWAKSCIR